MLRDELPHLSKGTPIDAQDGEHRIHITIHSTILDKGMPPRKITYTGNPRDLRLFVCDGKTKSFQSFNTITWKKLLEIYPFIGEIEFKRGRCEYLLDSNQKWSKQ